MPHIYQQVKKHLKIHKKCVAWILTTFQLPNHNSANTKHLSRVTGYIQVKATRKGRPASPSPKDTGRLKSYSEQKQSYASDS